MRRLSCVLAIVAVWAAASAQAAVVWDEASDGDLSGDRLNPNAFVLATGNNNLIGSVVGGDLDYVTMTVPAGTELAQIILENYASSDATAFIGVQQGTTFTEPPVGTNVGNLLGYSHIGPGGAPQGTDILDDIGNGIGAIGFTPPLPSGPYTFWIQQLGALTDYDFNFIVVPEPSSMLLAGIGAAAAVMVTRRLRRRARGRRPQEVSQEVQRCE